MARHTVLLYCDPNVTRRLIAELGIQTDRAEKPVGVSADHFGHGAGRCRAPTASSSCMAGTNAGVIARGTLASKPQSIPWAS